MVFLTQDLWVREKWNPWWEDWLSFVGHQQYCCCLSWRHSEDSYYHYAHHRQPEQSCFHPWQYLHANCEDKKVGKIGFLNLPRASFILLGVLMSSLAYINCLRMYRPMFPFELVLIDLRTPVSWTTFLSAKQHIFSRGKNFKKYFPPKFMILEYSGLPGWMAREAVVGLATDLHVMQWQNNLSSGSKIQLTEALSLQKTFQLGFIKAIKPCQSRTWFRHGPLNEYCGEQVLTAFC